ncbi:conserved hypothetical protein [Ricinus communis]|uniref:RNase H type-1 domain-containing protein n=1 Tax=Ricinus communis TaxID=3988 RepID=B9T188_RICCO|nr:conserved hypothetical protein [Ricinus communis]
MGRRRRIGDGKKVLYGRNHNFLIIMILSFVVNVLTDMRIYNIPLSPQNSKDKWSWFFDKKGSYMVKSVHRTLRNRGEQVSNHRDYLFWNKHWQLHIPPKGQSYLEQRCIAQKRNDVHQNVPAHQSSGIWTCPVEGWLKCNIDVVVFVANNRLGFGFIFQNDSGTFRAATNGLISGPLDPQVAEALSLREDLCWVKGLDLNYVVSESDCLTLVNAVNKVGVNSSLFGLLIGDCRSFLKEMNHAHIVFVKRFGNRVAHLLARVTDSEVDHGEWFD